MSDDTGKISDGYHTFDELYDHRITLYIVLCRELAGSRHDMQALPWRSRLHSDGSVIEGWFVLGIGTKPGQQITYHLPVERWGNTGFARTLDRAPEFDGHTSADVLERLKRL